MNQTRILLVSERSDQQSLFSRVIRKGCDVKIDVVPQGKDILTQFKIRPYSLVILAGRHSKMVLLEEVKKASPETRVILISSQPRISEAVSAIRMGAEDYLPSTIATRALQKVVKRSLSQRADFHCLAYIDEATKLYNSRYLKWFLEKEIQRAEVLNQTFALLFIDVDQFKKINDRLGHLVGTRLLRDLGAYLKHLVRERDAVFRYGGDEFIAVLSDCNFATARSVAERIRTFTLKKTFLKRKNRKIPITLSIGVALYPIHGTQQKSLIELADLAMYQAKKNGRNRIEFGEVSKRWNR